MKTNQKQGKQPFGIFDPAPSSRLLGGSIRMYEDQTLVPLYYFRASKEDLQSGNHHFTGPGGPRPRNNAKTASK